MASLLVVDDDRTILHMIERAFDDSAVSIIAVRDPAEVLEVIRLQQPDVVLLDIMLPETSGLEMFPQIHELDPKLPIIFITSGGASDTTIEAMKLGAHDFLLKPLDLNQLRKQVKQAIEIRRLMLEPVAVPGHKSKETAHEELVGSSLPMLDVYKAIGRVAQEDVTCLICGESGTGKELVARAIYHHSKRSKGPFLAVNCAAIPESLLESELFGHEQGAFTGADRRRLGKFEQCDGGTLFLDEVGDMPAMLQSKMLRILQEQRFERVGGNETIQVDVRVIAATNRDLEAMVDKAEFRADLYYRLNGFTLGLAPLRDRGSDIDLLVEYFLTRLNKSLNRNIVRISDEAMELLRTYEWPGNVRELQAILKQSILQTTGSVVAPDFLPDVIRRAASPCTVDNEDDSTTCLKRFINQRLAGHTSDLYAESLEWMERYLVGRVLRMTDGNQTKASSVLGITRGSLRNKIRSLGISVEQVVHVDGDEEGEDD
ncbi:sigma-54-dependent transcriptional regulator [Lignipirellula cremea]|uniref:DNA-binding transcriptional regulator NtrC n=1 Tax=Lignipirellula cremea TaxID=2528010 RepID=A0A518DVW4_9BACT|nr:sigma-54 dependent transcriptional regulator [Lignipirellula cremea]QDU95980.1 Nitrogen assimilation regulatory protein [Lignipirellula cremea]